MASTTPPRRLDTNSGVRISTEVDGIPLWFEVEPEHAALLSDRADPFAVALILQGMRQGRDLHVGGQVTDILLHQLNGDFQRLVICMHPSYRHIRVTTDETLPSPASATGVATGFSGGIDSFAVLAEYALAADVPAGLKVTHLINNNVGAYGSGGNKLWRVRCEALSGVADDLDFPFVKVDSNLESHFDPMGFQQTVTVRNAAVAHLLAGGIGRLHVASTFSFGQAGVLDVGDFSITDPMSLPLLSTPAMTITSAGAGVSRVEKTLALIGSPHARYLDVCVDPDTTRQGNCSRCWKCMRTMLTLEIAGDLGEFCPEPFRMEPYLEQRSQYVAEVLASNHPLSREVVEFAKERGWTWGFPTRTRARMKRMRTAVRHASWRVARALGLRRRWWKGSVREGLRRPHPTPGHDPAQRGPT
jgi:hypothetical protein